MREADSPPAYAPDNRALVLLAASFLLSAFIGFQLADGSYKSAFVMLTFFWLAFLLVRLSWRSLVYISLLLMTIPAREVIAFAGKSLRIVDILIPLTALGLVVEGILQNRRPFNLRAPFLKYLGLFFLIGIISLIRVYFTFDGRVFTASTVSFIRFWSFSLICLCIPGVVDNKRDLRRLVMFLSAICILHAGFGVLDSILYHLGRKNWIIYIYDFIGHSYINRFRASYRVGGLQFTPENLGIMLGSFLPFILLSLTLIKSNRRWGVLGLALVGVAVLQAQARSGLLLLLYFSIGFCLFGKLQPGFKQLILLGLSVLLLGVVLSKHFNQRLEDINQLFSSQERITPWTSVQSVKQAPDVWRDSLRIYKLQGKYLLGSGWATLNEYFYSYAYHGNPLQSRLWYIKGMMTARNTYLQFLNDTGLLGLLAFVAFWVSAIFSAFRLWRKATDPFIQNLCLAIWLFMIVRTFQNMYGVLLVRGDTYSIVSISWIYIGLLAAIGWLEMQPDKAV